MNREMKRRASQSKRASAADRQRAHRACARDPRRRSRTLSVVIACASVVVLMIMAIIPTYALSSGQGNERIWETASGVDSISISNQSSKWTFAYNTNIVGTDPSTLGHNLWNQSTVIGASTVIQGNVRFNNIITPHPYGNDETHEPYTKTITMPTFKGYWTSTEYEYYNRIQLDVVYDFNSNNNLFVPRVESMYYLYETEDGVIELDSLVYYNYSNLPTWMSSWPKSLRFDQTYTEFVWGTSAEGYQQYLWLLNNATFNTPSTTEDAYTEHQTNNPFARTLRSTMGEPTLVADKTYAVTSSYNIRKWWQSGTEDAKEMDIVFSGKNVTIPMNPESANLPMVDELGDMFAREPQYRTTAKIYYYILTANATNIYGNITHGYVIKEMDYDSGWKSAVNGFTIYPSIEDIFGTNTNEELSMVYQNIAGMIIDEYSTTLHLNSEAYNDNWQLRVTDYYYIDEALTNRLVYNFMMEREYPAATTPETKYNSLGKFLSNSIGSFFNTNLFGDISISDIMFVVIGIGLVVVFLKIFAGG